METEFTKQEAIDFFSKFYNGEHHIPGYAEGIKPCGLGWQVNHDRGCMSTYDFSNLTKLVVMAHDMCIRVQVAAVRNGIIQIAIHKRSREGNIMHAHPTLEQNISELRGFINK